MSHAVVADFPVPVAPSRTVSVTPELTRSASALMAAGWSPEGWYSLTTRKRPRVGRMSVVARTRSTVRPTSDRTASVSRPCTGGTGGTAGLAVGACTGWGRRLASPVAGAVTAEDQRHPGSCTPDEVGPGVAAPAGPADDAPRGSLRGGRRRPSAPPPPGRHEHVPRNRRPAEGWTATGAGNVNHGAPRAPTSPPTPRGGEATGPRRPVGASTGGPRS